MGREKNPDRAKAKRIWMKAKPGTIKLSDIAAKLGYTDSTISRWKREDNWEAQEQGMPRKRGAQPGNKNAVGHGAPIGSKNAAGHGAPIGNQNSLVHGGYSRVFFDTLDDTELELIESMNQDEEQLLVEEIQLLTVRERRIMQRIRQYSEKSVYTASAIKTEERRSFDGESDEERIAQSKLYKEKVQQKVNSGERLPGNAYRFQTVSEASYSIVLKLEEALTRCQSQKQRAIDSLNKIRAAKQSSSTEIEDMYLIRKVVFGSDDGSGENA